MTSVDVNDVLKRTQSTANGSTTDFTFSFQVNATNEIKVYEDTTLKTEGTPLLLKLGRVWGPSPPNRRKWE